MENKDLIPLSLRLNFLCKKFRVKIQEKWDELNINHTYANIIMFLANKDKFVNQNDICERLHLAKPTISLTIKNMEQEGLIKKEVDSVDSRKSSIILTDKGYELDDKIKKIFQETEKELILNIDEDKMKGFIDVLEIMDSNLEGESK